MVFRRSINLQKICRKTVPVNRGFLCEKKPKSRFLNSASVRVLLPYLVAKNLIPSDITVDYASLPKFLIRRLESLWPKPEAMVAIQLV